MDSNTAAPEVRKKNLANAVSQEVASGGWRVESQADFQTILVKGKETNHTFHLVLSLVTCGLWLFVWPIVWYLNQRKALVMSVDEYGNVLRQS